MTAQTKNKVTVPVGTDGWNVTAHILGAFESAGLIVEVADLTERNAQAALWGGTLPVPFVVSRTDLYGALEVWDGTRWVTDQRPRSKHSAGTATGSLTVAAGWIDIATAYTTPANPFGTGVPYKIVVNAQCAPTNGASGAVAMRVLFNAATAEGGQSQTPTMTSPGTLAVRGRKYVADGSAQTVSVQVSALTATATLAGGSAIYWYTVDFHPVVNI